MIAILEKYEHNVDFHQIVDFVEASHIRIETTDEGTKILATVDGKLRTISESSIRRNLKLNDEDGISTLLNTELFENLTLMGPKSTGFNEFSSNIATDVSKIFGLDCPTVDSMLVHQGEDEPASPLGDDSQGEACPTFSGLEVGHDSENIIKSSTLPHDLTPRVTCLAADEGSMQQQLNELIDLCTRLQRQPTEMATKIAAQDLEISNLKAMIKILEDKDKGGAEPSGEDATIKGKKKMVESPTQKKKKLQEQIDVHVAREMEEQLDKEDQTRDEQIARDAEIARIHAEEELQMLIDGLDRNNEMIAKDQEIFMLVEKDYPLRKGLVIVMISNKLQVENYSQMASDLIQKIYKIAISPRQRDD
nr:hypothetical protein [Tanacetum cinerariifolium]